MTVNRRTVEELARLKKMGWALLTFALATTAVVYCLPDNDSIYWLSSDGKEGFYVLSAFFAFLGLYCLGAIWRRRHFI